jgi:hypothetical protein
LARGLLSEIRATGAETRPNPVSGECSDLQPTLPDDGTYSRRREAPARIGIVIHLGDIDLGSAACIIQDTAYDQRTTGIALDQQDHLTIPEQRSKRSRHRRLRIAACHDYDDACAIDSGCEIGRDALGRGKPTSLAFDIDPTAPSYFREPCFVDIVQPQLAPGEAQFGDEIETTDSGADYGDGLRGVCRPHPFPLELGAVRHPIQK